MIFPLKKCLLVILLTASGFTVTASYATPMVINLDATQYGNPDDSLGKEIFFEAGNYTATIINPTDNPNALFTAYSWYISYPHFFTAYLIGFSDGSATVMGGELTPYATASDAFNGLAVYTLNFTVLTDQNLYFGVYDSILSDNRGGISLLVEEAIVSIPSTLALLLLGAIGLTRIKKDS